jgi:hypothetical protein
MKRVVLVVRQQDYRDQGKEYTEEEDWDERGARLGGRGERGKRINYKELREKVRGVEDRQDKDGMKNCSVTLGEREFTKVGGTNMKRKGEAGLGRCTPSFEKHKRMIHL